VGGSVVWKGEHIQGGAKYTSLYRRRNNSTGSSRGIAGQTPLKGLARWPLYGITCSLE